MDTFCVFLKKNEPGFKYESQKYINIKNECRLDENKTIFIYNENCELLGIKYKDFFNEEEITTDLIKDLKELNDEQLKIHYYTYFFLKQKTRLNKSLKPILKKLEKYFKNYFYLETRTEQGINLFTTKFNNIQVIKNKRLQLKKSEALKHSIIFNLTDNLTTLTNYINIPEYNISIPINTNKDLIIFNTRDYYYCNSKIETKNLINIEILP